jgi:hypothetical protein
MTTKLTLGLPEEKFIINTIAREYRLDKKLASNLNHVLKFIRDIRKLLGEYPTNPETPLLCPDAPFMFAEGRTYITRFKEEFSIKPAPVTLRCFVADGYRYASKPTKYPSMRTCILTGWISGERVHTHLWRYNSRRALIPYTLHGKVDEYAQFLFDNQEYILSKIIERVLPADIYNTVDVQNELTSPTLETFQD